MKRGYALREVRESRRNERYFLAEKRKKRLEKTYLSVWVILKKRISAKRDGIWRFIRGVILTTLSCSA